VRHERHTRARRHTQRAKHSEPTWSVCRCHDRRAIHHSLPASRDTPDAALPRAAPHSATASTTNRHRACLPERRCWPVGAKAAEHGRCRCWCCWHRCCCRRWCCWHRWCCRRWCYWHRWCCRCCPRCDAANQARPRDDRTRARGLSPAALSPPHSVCAAARAHPLPPPPPHATPALGGTAPRCSAQPSRTKHG
jgi:hypothetical protein